MTPIVYEAPRILTAYDVLGVDGKCAVYLGDA